MAGLQDILHYFDPVGPLAAHADDRTLTPHGETVSVYRSGGKKPDTAKASVIIAGMGNPAQADEIRRYLYGLVSILPEGEIADLGNLREGRSPADTLTGVSDVITELGKARKTLVVIGRDSHDIRAYCKAYDRLETPYNLAVIDSIIDIMPESQAAKSHYLNPVISDAEGALYDFVHLGYQSYFNDPASLDRLGELFFEHHRLGKLRDDIRESEPVFRNSDLVAFSMNAIRQTEAPGVTFPSANGFTAEEACQLSRFAGLSDKLSLFALCGFRQERDLRGQTASLAAQVIWHFMQGFSQRKNDYPFSDIRLYQKYLINLPKTGFNLVFYKSPSSGRWWMEIPHPDPKYPRVLYVACSPSDYQIAVDGEVPDRWWNHYRRLS